MKRKLSHGFSVKALSEQEDIVNDYLDKLIRQINVYATGPKGDEMVKWYNFFTFDVIGDLAFGESFGSLNDGMLCLFGVGLVGGSGFLTNSA